MENNAMDKAFDLACGIDGIAHFLEDDIAYMEEKYKTVDYQNLCNDLQEVLDKLRAIKRRMA